MGGVIWVKEGCGEEEGGELERGVRGLEDGGDTWRGMLYRGLSTRSKG